MNEKSIGVENSNENDSIKIYNPLIFIILSPIFSFLLPGILFSVNIGRMGNRRKQYFFLALFITLFLIFLAFSYYLIPDSAMGFDRIVFMGINIGMGYSLYHFQKADYDGWILCGAKKTFPGWYIFVGSILLGLMTVLIYLSRHPELNEGNMGVYKEKEDTLFYDRTIPIDDIKTLYAGLEKLEAFQEDQHLQSPILVDRKDMYLLEWPMNEGVVYDAKIESIKEQLEEYINGNLKLKKPLQFIPVDSKAHPLEKQ